jgi:hypothetical protein
MPDKSARPGGDGAPDSPKKRVSPVLRTPFEWWGYTPTDPAPLLPNPPLGGSGISPAPGESKE